MKKTIAFMLVLVMVLVAFAGCKPAETSQTETSTQPSESTGGETASPVTIDVVTSYGGDDGNRQNYLDALAGYEAATGNKVQDASATSNEEWKAKVMADFETGTEPDVLFYFLGNDANPIVEADKVVSLEEIRAAYPEYADNMKEEMLVPSVVDDKVYAVPSTGYWESLFVNKTVLEAAGVEMPGADYTWEQFLVDCEKIKTAGYTPIAVSLQEVPHYWFEFSIYNHGNPSNHLDIPGSATDATGQIWADGLEDLKSLYDAGYLPENTLTATDAETVQLVVDGEAAFLIDGSWKVGYFTENAADHLDDFALTYVPGQGERKATDIIGGISMGYYITRKAWDDPEKRDAAVKFVEYMTSDEVLPNFVTTQATALKNPATRTDLNVLEQSAASMYAGMTSMVGAAQDLLSGEARTDLFANVKNVVTGAMTPEEAIDSALALNAQ